MRIPMKRSSRRCWHCNCVLREYGEDDFADPKSCQDLHVGALTVFRTLIKRNVEIARMAQKRYYYATGKRKTAVARVWLQAGEGKIMVNQRPIDDYFGGLILEFRKKIEGPLELTDNAGKFDVIVSLKGGGQIRSDGSIATRHCQGPA